ncbi:MAG: Na+/H+ antiporter, partial [Candidatus Dormibacteraeota bacterium]|nr:Na+/H+ antiporter [Candidatus Dormibacteraeota bacterium]
MPGAESATLPNLEMTIFWMLVVVAVVALLTQRIRIPYTIALVVAGLVLAVIPGTPTITLTPDLIVAVFLPVLVFEAAYNLHFPHLRENLRPITILAIPGVLLTAALTGAVVHWVGGFDWGVALLFGAIVAATDPVSVVALFKELGAPPRLRTILEGESLFNDGTAIVLFNLILGIILAGVFDPVASLTAFVIVVGGGLGVGLILGYIFSVLLRQVNEYLIETVLTLVLAYGTYFVAERLHVSGIIAIVAAGVLVGNFGQRVAFSPTSKIAVGLSWELFGFLANSLIFLFVGLQIKPVDFAGAGEIVALAIGAVLVARGLVVLGVGALLRALRRDPPLSWPWQTVLFWGGLRGAVSLALALSIPLALDPAGHAFPHRATIILMTFGVILFSLLVQGLTMKPLLRRLGLGRPTTDLAEYEDTQAQLRAVNAAVAHLEQHAQGGQVPPEVIATLRAEYKQRAQTLQGRL